MSIGIVESIGGPLGPPEGPLQAICLGIGDTDPPRQLLGTLPAPYRVVPTSNCLLSGFEDWRELDVVAVRWRSSTYAEVDFTGLGVPATILVRRHHGKWIAEIARVVAKG
jgi:hypothetical protein